MDQPRCILLVQIVVALAAGINVALNSWLVHRRYNADKRDHSVPEKDWHAFVLWRDYVKTPDDRDSEYRRP